MLIDLQPEELEEAPRNEDFKTHVEFSQVVLDVNRSIKRFPPGIPFEHRVAMQDQLIRLILRVITKYPQLQYYQVGKLVPTVYEKQKQKNLFFWQVFFVIKRFFF